MDGVLLLNESDILSSDRDIEKGNEVSKCLLLALLS